MAQDRIAVGGLTVAVVVLVLAVAGCGGGNSSASGTAGTGASTSAKMGNSMANAESESGAKANKPDRGTASGSKVSGDKNDLPGQTSGSVVKKKHPPLELPTGKPEQGPTDIQRAEVPTANLAVSIPGGKLTETNTCGGQNLSPEVEWAGIPGGSAELVLFVLNLQPVEGKLYFDWAVAGIDPSSSGLKAGELPRGAVVGRNSAGQDKYSLCPQGSGKENYVFALYALPKALSPKQGFEPLALRQEAMQQSQSIGLYTAEY